LIFLSSPCLSLLNAGVRKGSTSQVWWHTPLIPALGRQSQADLWISEFKANLVYRVSSRTSKATQRNLVSKKPKKKREREREGSTESEFHYPTQEAGAGGLLHVPGRLEIWSKTTLYPYTQTAGMGGREGKVGMSVC
jgi:hypothetical protein